MKQTIQSIYKFFILLLLETDPNVCIIMNKLL